MPPSIPTKVKERNPVPNGPNTKLVHGGETINTTRAVSCPIFQSSTYHFESNAAMQQAVSEPTNCFYGRCGTPNCKQAEEIVANLEGAEDALVTGSGMAAVSTLFLTFLEKGDHVIAQTTHYPGVINLLQHRMGKFGVETSFVDSTDTSAIKGAIRHNTRLIYLESPANPTLRLVDIIAVAQLAKDSGILTCVDSTFATPVNQNPIKLGADLVLHSATKYLAGHSDVVAGVIAGSRNHIQLLYQTYLQIGAVLHPMEAWLLVRGLRTLRLRVQRQNANGYAVAKFLEGHPQVERVFYPGLQSHPEHSVARKQMKGYSSMIAFHLRGGFAACEQLLDNLSIIMRAVSLGGIHTLITHPYSSISSFLKSSEVVLSTGALPNLMRISVGLEDVEDIIGDLKNALDGIDNP